MNISGGKKRVRDDCSTDESTAIREASLSLGTFSGTCIYQNRLHLGETFENGHVSIHNLVLPDCTLALVTTFCFDPVTDQAWLESIFSPQTQVTFVAHHANGPNVGHATLQQLYPTTPNWLLLGCKPHAGGCLHPKLLLFRNRYGIRVVVSGNNFFQGQWQVDRDVLWIQDFFNGSSSAGGGYGGEFQATLVTFVQDLVKCESNQNQGIMNQRMGALLQGVDFMPAKGRLVTSFPTSGTSSTRDRGGYRQLAMAVRSFQNELDAHGSDTSSHHSHDESHNDQNHANEGDYIPEGNVMYATSGSMGDVQPDFMLQMYQAFCIGRDVHASKSTPWHVLYNKIKILWPSRETALTMNLMALIGSGRSMSRSHWNNVIPDEAKRCIFMDARPNPSTKGDLNYFPFAHCKIMYFATPHTSVVYVGSHNFSKSAWGLRGEMPKNVELGVVLATTFPNVRNEWKSRLPCLLPVASETSPPSYIPASAHSGIRQVLQEGHVQEAIEMTIEWLSRDEDSDDNTQKNAPTLSKESRDSGANENDDKDSNVIKAEVVDLCDSD